MFHREVVRPSRGLAAKLVAGAFVVGVLGSVRFAPRVLTYRGESKLDIATLVVRRLAHEAYPQWQRQYHARCPHSVYELTELMDSGNTIDPWGNPYQMFCRNGGVAVLSTGEDGIANTADDIRSDR